MNKRKDILSNTDDLLAELDNTVREASDLKLRLAVERLIDSAAQNTGVGPCLWPEAENPCDDSDEDLGQLTSAVWHHSITYAASADLVYRLCDGVCIDEDMPPNRSCLDLVFDKDDMGLTAFTGFHFEGMDEGIMPGATKIVERTISNLDVLEDPPDGIDMGYEAKENFEEGDCYCPNCVSERLNQAEETIMLSEMTSGRTLDTSFEHIEEGTVIVIDGLSDFAQAMITTATNVRPALDRLLGEIERLYGVEQDRIRDETQEGS
jgi:hypothetical protein